MSFQTLPGIRRKAGLHWPKVQWSTLLLGGTIRPRQGKDGSRKRFGQNSVMHYGYLRMSPKLASFRHRLCRSIAGMAIATLTIYGSATTVLSTFAVGTVVVAPQIVVAQSQTRSSGGY